MINERILTLKCYRKKYNIRKIKKYIFTIILIILFLFLPHKVFAEDNNEIMQTTQDKFNISDFIKESQKYTGDFF